MMKVRQFEGYNGPVRNQFILEGDGKVIFQSYSTIIAMKENGKIIIDNEAENYSRTTSKYLYQFFFQGFFQELYQ